VNTVTDPTDEQIVQFCKHMEESLLAARRRGSLVEIGFKQETEDAYDRERYGATPVDAWYVGAQFLAKFRERDF
jgi:hypothetical protein